MSALVVNSDSAEKGLGLGADVVAVAVEVGGGADDAAGDAAEAFADETGGCIGGGNSWGAEVGGAKGPPEDDAGAGWCGAAPAQGGGATLADTTGDLALKLRRPPVDVAVALAGVLLGVAWGVVVAAAADDALLLRLLTFLREKYVHQISIVPS
jgi:hypothetical protein